MIVLVVVGVALMIPGILLCRWLYKTGERQYWGRVHNEQNRRASTSDDDVEIVTDDNKELFA